MMDEGSRYTREEERVREALRTLGDVPADDRFRQRLRYQFVSGAFAEPQPAARRRPFVWRPVWQVALVLVVAVAALFLFLDARGPAWRLSTVAGVGEIRVNGETVESQDVGRLAPLIRAGARIQVTESAELDVVAGDVLLLELASGADATLPEDPRRWFPRPLHGVLHAGELRLQTGPAFPGRHLTVLTAEGRIEVTGTVISIYKGDTFTCVCVLEGSARIGKDDARMETVAAGLRKVMFSGDRPSEIIAIEPHHEADLLDFLERNAGVFD